MRTSASQFQIIVEFMERYGDLSKPTEGPQGRANNGHRWEELTNMLNADATGDTKTVEKWRKVWSDYKNNTKKKAARIYRATRGTGGGPASSLNLTDLEQRVLNLVGTQAATGLIEIPEIGVEEAVEPPPVNNDEENSMEALNSYGTIRVRSPPTLARLVTGTSVASVMGGDVPQPSTSARQRESPSPTFLASTPNRRRRGRLGTRRSSPIRRRNITQSELARQTFVRSDNEWRAFQRETERERNRIRELELRMQERWLELGNKFYAILDRLNQ